MPLTARQMVRVRKQRWVLGPGTATVRRQVARPPSILRADIVCVGDEIRLDRVRFVPV